MKVILCHSEHMKASRDLEIANGIDEILDFATRRDAVMALGVHALPAIVIQDDAGEVTHVFSGLSKEDGLAAIADPDAFKVELDARRETERQAEQERLMAEELAAQEAAATEESTPSEAPAE